MQMRMRILRVKSTQKEQEFNALLTLNIEHLHFSRATFSIRFDLVSWSIELLFKITNTQKVALV